MINVAICIQSHDMLDELIQRSVSDEVVCPFNSLLIQEKSMTAESQLLLLSRFLWKETEGMTQALFPFSSMNANCHSLPTDWTKM